VMEKRVGTAIWMVVTETTYLENGVNEIEMGRGDGICTRPN
jgi:hypothetical protein